MLKRNFRVLCTRGPVMRILIGCDDPAEGELIALYLNASGENEAVVATNAGELAQPANGEAPWDVIMMTTTTPDHDAAFELFQKVRAAHPASPVVGACKSEDVYRLARFITHG